MNDSPLKLTDLVCFSHLRWNFVYQRPQHLLSRFAKCFRVFYIEEPIFHANTDRYDISISTENVVIVVPHLQGEGNRPDALSRQQQLLQNLFEQEKISNCIFWYYTPMYLKVTEGLKPRLVIYDCMDELSAFKGASSELKDMEAKLFGSADLVFTGGHSLYEAKKKHHPKTFCFPSSIDRAHFENARSIKFDPPDQDSIPHPRIGFYGVIDERMDIDLLEKIARLRPQWNFIMIGPVVKINPSTLPNFHNIHYLGSKSYNELPHYLAGWDIAMIPFAHNESTRFISPTKTPEYLAGGKPVISTPIIDVIRPYGNKGYVRIAGTPEEFVRVTQEELELDAEDRTEWLEKVDDYLAQNSWNKTWGEMMSVIGTSVVGKSVEKVQNIKGGEYV
jgi:glycosyltransferase involved in cell wall biosynthesis